jgi:hypothetical protein
MNMFDRMQQKQQEALDRQRNLQRVGDELGNMLGSASRITQTLRGSCPNCGTAVAAQSKTGQARVGCPGCNQVIIIQG